MKHTILLLGLILFSLTAQAQFGNMLDKAKKKAEEKLNKKTTEAENKAEDKIENRDHNTSHSGSPTSNNTSTAPASENVRSYSKFDFVSGEKIVVIEDFMQDAVGDFPDKWNTNASGEIVTIGSHTGHWLLLTRAGAFHPEFIDTLPDNFTFEFDLFCIQGNKTGGWGTFHTAIAQLTNREKPQNWQMENNNFYFSVYGGNSTEAAFNYSYRKNGNNETAIQLYTKQLNDKSKPIHVAMWRQKERLRVYFNEEKLLDIPKAFAAGIQYNSIIYFQPTVDEANQYAVSNLRLAVGAPDTRNKLLTEGKWVTNGILFNVNSADIKPESYGTIKEIATVLKENESVRVKIIGHTDSDGDDKLNLDLSKRRAASVMSYLIKEFSINESRMETDGLGESKPIDKNTTPEGKANNRRVEFVKI